jgi:G3E family GTPase
MISDKSIVIYLITGFLGAGKTIFLKNSLDALILQSLSIVEC